MPILQTILSETPRVGRQGVVYSWPRAINYLGRPGELGPDEAVDLVDFISGDDGLFVRDGFSQLGSAALDNIPLRLALYEQEDLDKFTMAHTKTKLYQLVGTTWTDISRAGGYTGTDDQPYDSVVCLNDYVFTAYADRIQFWDGVAATALDLLAVGLPKAVSGADVAQVTQGATGASTGTLSVAAVNSGGNTALKPAPASTISFVAASAAASAAHGDLVVTPPATLTDDILICAVTTRNNVAVTFPASWTIYQQGNNGSSLRSTLAWKRASGAEAAFTITHSGVDAIAANVVVYRDCVTDATVINASSLTHNVSSTTCTAASVTTTIDGCRIVFTMHASGNSSSSAQSSANLGAMAERFDNASTLGGSLEFTRAKYCVAFAGRLFIANLIEESPSVVRALRVRWSTELAYRSSGDWTGLGSGFNDLAETPDEIVGMAKVGNILVVYKKRSIVHGYETGNINAPIVWEWKWVATSDKGTGLVAHQTLADLQGFHIGLFNDNVYRYDGSRPVPIGDAVIRDVVRLAGVANLRKSFAAVDPTRGWYILFVATAGQTWPEQAYVYDYRRDLWVGKLKRKFSTAGLNVPTGTTTWASTDPQTWADVDASWGSFGLETDLPILTIGSPDDKTVRQSDSSVDYDGAGADWITRDDDLGAPDFVKTLIRVRLRVDASAAQPVTLAVSRDSGRSFGQVLVKNTLAVNGEQDIFFDTRLTGARFTLKISSAKRIRIVEWAPSFQLRERTK